MRAAGRFGVGEPLGLPWPPLLSGLTGPSEVAYRFAGAFVVEDFESGLGEAPLGLANATQVYWKRKKL